MHFFRSNFLRWPTAVSLLLGTLLWLVVPQAFAASTADEQGGWMTQFVGAGELPDVPVSEHGLQDAADAGSLIVQPVVVPATASAPMRAAFQRPSRSLVEAGSVRVLPFIASRSPDWAAQRFMGSSLQPKGP